MMLRVNNEYLDFNQPVLQDRKAKLFEEIDKIEGDVSFEFQLYLSSQNIRILNFPFPDSSSKTVYRAIEADLLNEEGQLVSNGFIKIERKINLTLFCSFFGGNSNWFAMLSGNLTDLRLTQYDADQTVSTITSSWSNSSGIVWPMIDTGALSTRSFRNLKVEDFAPCLYVKTLMFQLFQQSGLKLSGELLDDWRYNNLVMASNGRSQEEIDNRSTFALKNTTQSIPPSTIEVIEYDDDSSYPYFDGSQDNFSLITNRYTADVKMSVNVTVTVNLDNVTGANALLIAVSGFTQKFIFQGGNVLSLSANLLLNAGDYITTGISTGSLFGVDIVGATIKITPTYIYKAFGKSSVPKWTKQQFVSQVLAIFNVVPAYDPYTKTVTLNLFDKIKSKEPIDISEFVEAPEIDYSEFISDYGRSNNFRYQETDIDNLQEYNISTFLKYGTGVIPVDNDFIEESKDVLESDFAAPISYINGAFDMSLERIPFVELEEDVNTTFTGVADSGGLAQFNVTDDLFSVGDLVRVSDSTNNSYNGEFLVATVGSGFITLREPAYDTNATGTITKLVHQFTTDDSVYLFLNIPNYTISKASGNTSFYLEDTTYSSIAIAYFNLLNTGNQINTEYKQGLSFGSIVNPLFYQRTMLQDYWATFGRILNDPVKLKQNAYLPWKIHNQIDFLRPIMIKTLETTNLYYCNLERGYQNSYTPVELELIKLP